MRPIPIFNRKKGVRTWIKEQDIYIESYLEDAVHFIVLTLVVHKEKKIIRQIKTQFLRSPYPDICPKVEEFYQNVIGLKIEKGFMRSISEKVMQNQSCTHIQALLKEAADAFMQTFYYETAGNLDGIERRKVLIQHLKNNCLAYSEENNKNIL